MDIKVEEISPTRKSVTVQVSADEVNLAEKDLIREFMAHANLHGFRKGKAPEHVVKSKYKKQITEELKSKVVSKAYEAAQKGTEFEFFAVVDANPLSDVLPSTPVDINFQVDTLPEFTLPEFKGINVELPTVDVSEDEVQDAVNNMLEQRAEYEVVDAPAQKGDYVKLAYEGKIDDKLISEIAPEKPIYGTQSATWEEAGAEDNPGVQAVINGIIGLKKDDQSILPMEFPKDFEIKELAGKKAEYHVSIQEVRQKKLPAINEELLKSIGVDSEEAMRNKIKEEFLKKKSEEQNYAAKDQIINFLTENTTFDVPQSAVDSATQTILKRQMTQMIQYGMSQDQIESQKDMLIEKASEAAISQAKTAIILTKIAKEEKIEINNQDLSMRVMQEAMATGTNPDKFVTELKKDRSRIDEIREATLVSKVLDFLHKESKIQNKEGSVKSDS